MKTERKQTDRNRPEKMKTENRQMSGNRLEWNNAEKNQAAMSRSEKNNAEKKQASMSRSEKKNAGKRQAAVTKSEKKKAEKKQVPVSRFEKGKADKTQGARKKPDPVINEKAVKAAKKKSRCPVSALCGGCTMIDVPYDEQILGKQKILDELIGDYVTPDPFIRMKAPEHYRHKVTSVFASDRKGKPVCGIYREGTHEVVPVKACLIEHIEADRIVQTIYKLLADFRIRVYDEDLDMGLLRYVQIRAARATKEIMVTLVLTDPVLPSRNTFVKKLVKLHPEITTIVINVNDRNTTMVLGNRETVIYGKGYIEDILCGKRFRISSRSFYQVNPLMTEKLYNIAIDCAALSGRETILDAYCGIGTIGIIAAPHARRVIGVELNADAVRDAQHNIHMNGLTNVEILQGDATRFMEDLAAGHRDISSPDIDVIFMDPPRSGSTEEFMHAACAVLPKKIVYISCSPWSLQRDLEYLTQNGYKVKKAIPVDMFPFTGGIETVVLLTHTK